MTASITAPGRCAGRLRLAPAGVAHHAGRRSGDGIGVSGRYWAGLAATAERGLLDFLTIDDTLTPQPGRRESISPRRLAGRADAVLVAARIAPVTEHIGLIPVATVTHTEPFHVSKAIATLDHVSHGRAGWQPRVSSTAHEAALFGRRDASADADELFDEAADAVEVVRRLWDSWEDDAIIRDAADRALHRPGQAALHRLSRQVLFGERPVDHPASAAGAAGGRGAGARTAHLRIRRGQRRSGLHHAHRRCVARRDPRRGQGGRRTAFEGLRRRGGDIRRRHRIRF